MAATISPTQSNIQAALVSFLGSFLPSGVVVRRGQQSRVSEPSQPNYVVMTPITTKRLATNVDSYLDNLLVGSIGGATMTIDEVVFGSVVVGAQIYGEGVTADTTVTAFGTGTGGVGTYTVTPSQTVEPDTNLAWGTVTKTQEVEWDFQLDFHGPLGGDYAALTTTLLRDDYAVQQFLAQEPNYGVSPLHADDSRQVPFENDQQQYEDMWVVTARLQANQQTIFPQQYADVVSVDVISARAQYPA